MKMRLLFLIILVSAPAVISADSDDHDSYHDGSHSDMSYSHDPYDEYYDSSHEDDYDSEHHSSYSKHDYGKDDYDYDDSHEHDYSESLTDRLHEYNAAAQNNGLVVCLPGVQFIRHPFRCDQFFQCAHGQAHHVVTCPGNLMFNTHLNVCDWPSNVDCDDSGSFGNLYHFSDSHSDDFTGQYDRGDSYSSYHDDSSDDDDNDGDDDDDSMDHDDDDDLHDHDSDDDYSSDYDDGYNDNYDYIHPHQLGPRPLHVNSPNLHGYLPVQWRPHPAFGLSGPYQPSSSGQGSMTSGLYQQHDNFSPILAALFDLQYHHHPSRYGNYRYHQGYPQHQQYYHFSPRLGYHFHSDNSYDHDHDYYDNDENHHGHDSHDDSYDSDDDDDDDGDDHHHDSHDDSHDDSGDSYRHYDSDEGRSYEDARYDPHNMHGDYMERYQDSGSYNQYRHANQYHSDSDEVEEQSAWLYPYFRSPSRNRKLEPRYHPEQDVQYVHYVHDGGPYPEHNYHHGGRSEHGILGGGENTLLPLLLLKSPEAKQLLMTSTILSKLKGVTGDGLLKGSGSLSDLMVRHTLLDLLTHSQQTSPPTTPDQNRQARANLRFDPATRTYISLATDLPTQLINPTTNQAVAPLNTFVDPLSGQVSETATGHPLGILEPLTGTLVPAIVQARRQQQQPQQQQPQQTAQRFAVQQPALLQTRAGQGALTPNQQRASVFQGQGLNGANGNDALNLIILSPLTPSSLPPPLLSNTGSDALIRGSLREVLGPGLADVVEQSSAPLVPGQRLPNAAAGGGQFCTVVRSGESVPFRLNPRGGRQLSRQECDAMGQVLDTFIPTYLRTFVTRDAALAGFNRVGLGARSGTAAQDPFSPLSGNPVQGTRDGNLNSGIGSVGNGIFDNPSSTNNDGFSSLFNTNVNRDLRTNNDLNFNVVDGLSNNNLNSNQRQLNTNFAGGNGIGGSTISSNNNRNNINSLLASNNLSDFISVRQDITGCSILVPNIIPQC